MSFCCTHQSDTRDEQAQNKVLKPNYKNDLKNKTKKQVTISSTQVYTQMVLQTLKKFVLVVAQLNTNSIQFIFFFFCYQWSSVNSLTITVIIGGLCWRGKKKRKGGWGGDGGSLMWVWWHPLNEGAKGGRLLLLGGARSSLCEGKECVVSVVSAVAETLILQAVMVFPSFPFGFTFRSGHVQMYINTPNIPWTVQACWH